MNYYYKKEKKKENLAIAIAVAIALFLKSLIKGFFLLFIFIFKETLQIEEQA